MVPEDEEITLIVSKLKNGKSPGLSKLRAETLKEWLEEATWEEEPYTENWDQVTSCVKLCFVERSIYTDSIILVYGGPCTQRQWQLPGHWPVGDCLENYRVDY